MVEELLRRVDFVNMLPASAEVWLKKSREADVLEDVLPVQRENQVTHGLVCRPRRMLVVRQQYRRRKTILHTKNDSNFLHSMTPDRPNGLSGQLRALP